ENPQEHKRHITIKTDNIRFDENYIQLNPETAPGQHVYFSVTDTGVGISKEIVSKIFDPFFTTKDIGKGTGLGLATVYGIAKQNKGTVLVSSKLKKGTTISICWPATDEVAVTAQPTSPQVHTGVETILLVEDNYEVRNFVRTALSSLGFTIFEAENGKQALEIMRQHHREINLIFTDVIMEEMNGRELAVTVQKKYTGTPILFTSGHADDLIDTTAEFVNQHNFLHKPYSIATLSQKIRNSLDTKKTL
ncbi:response regulator, partial [bacterium]|nr:response regulator [bacterium]